MIAVQRFDHAQGERHVIVNDQESVYAERVEP
jgi:hypothetical protein